jgi:hypothetical protein
MVDPSPSAVVVDSAPSPAMRRSFTLPARFTESRTTIAANSVAGAGPKELLFSHDSRIVAFDTSRPISVGGVRADPEADEVGVLPWTSPTEMTKAVGRYLSIGFDNSCVLMRLPRSFVFVQVTLYCLPKLRSNPACDSPEVSMLVR